MSPGVRQGEDWQLYPGGGCRGGACDQLMKEVVKGWGEPRGHTRGGLAAVPRRGV